MELLAQSHKATINELNWKIGLVCHCFIFDQLLRLGEIAVLFYIMTCKDKKRDEYLTALDDYWSRKITFIYTVLNIHFISCDCISITWYVLYTVVIVL